MPLKSRAMTNAVAGVRWGMRVAAVLCLWVAVIAAINVVVSGSLTIRGRDGTSYHALAIMGAYLFAGATSGLIIGVLSPLLRWRVGAAVIGMLAAAPMFMGILMLRDGFSHWSTMETGVLAILVLAFGIPGGIIVRAFWIESTRASRKGEARHRAPRG